MEEKAASKTLSDANVGDLKKFLTSKKVDASACIEKKDLIDSVTATLEKEGLKVEDFFKWLESEGKPIISYIRHQVISWSSLY